MNAWLEIGLSNALVATLLAIVACLVTRVVRRPDVAYFVWLVVLLKLVSPPLVRVPLKVDFPPGFLADGAAAEPAASASETLPTKHIAGVTRDPTAIPTVAKPVGNDLSHRPAAGRRQSAASSIIDTSSPSSSTKIATDQAALDGGRFDTAVVTTTHAIASIWAMGSLVWLVVAAYRVVRFQRLLNRAAPAPLDWEDEISSLARRLGLRRAPTVRLAHRAVPPLVWNLAGQSTMLLPCDLLRTLTAEERSTLFAHELAHLVGRARAVRWLEFVCLALYWWHPVAWWARRQIEEAEELCCDARVVELLPNLAHSYANTLLSAVDFLSEARATVPLGARRFSQARHVKRRLDMILSGRKRECTGWVSRAALGITCLIALSLSVHVVSAEPATLASISAALTGADIKTLEERLDRLEKMVETLTAEVRSMRREQTADAPPVVLSTVPKTGAKDVDPNLKEIKVTFSKEMQDGRWSWTQRSDDTFPESAGKIHYEKDQRTCVMPVKLEPGKTYWIGLNWGKFTGFADQAGQTAKPYRLTFTTKK